MAHLVDATLFFSPTSGGVRRYLLAKHDWLTRRAPRSHTLLVPGPQDRGARGGIVEFKSPLIRAGYRCPLDLPRLRAALAALEPDLLEAGDPYLMGWQVAEVAASLDVPSVAFCHSDLIGLLAARLGAVGEAIAARYLAALYSGFDLVLAPSRFVAARLAAAGIARVAVQPLGVSAEVFDPRRRDGALRKRLELRPGTRLLVFAGRLAPEKNIAELLETVERLGDPYHLLLIGGTRTGRPTPRVTILPYECDDATVGARLAACDLLVHAGREETFGLIALEAMACGLPVVAYDGGALAEIVDVAVGGLAPVAGRSRALAAAVADVFARGAPALGAAARARVITDYTWDATLTHQLHRYASLRRGSAVRDDQTAPGTV
ncbi:MAG TPA: glycosyltransferase [Steroidobacteraceae bacterium]|nr:glycosyltransferase [Steroidobacteraceae bacterium]